MVGREFELTQLHGWLAKALSGERQIVFVSGEAGIGKTTVVEAFLQTLDSRRRTLDASVWIGRGQCIEHYGVGEAYLPILEALGRLCREPGSERLIALLKQHAPTWLVQMPTLLNPDDIETLQRKMAGATRERMLRELAEALEVITTERPLVLVLEDLHWSDVSTLDLLSMLARRQEPARLLIIGTYRPVEVLTREHPLKGIKQELHLHGQCEELALEFLSEAAVADYLVQRFGPQPPHPVPLTRGERGPIAVEPFHTLAHLIHQRTDGNPLFMVNVVDSLVARGVLVQSEGRWELQGKVEEVVGGVPESLQQLIEQQIERLRPETQRLLEVASVAGAEFSAATVAAGVETEVDGIEEQCGELVRREHFLRASGTAEWPDGTVAARYGFLHALYQEVLYHRLTARRRQRLHQRLGEREEAAYGERAGERAAELAVYFERGRNYRKAVQYLQQAGENAVQRSAHQEAVSLLTKGLELLKTLPDTPERTQQELTLQVALGAPLIATKGYSAPEVGKTYARARELCQQVGETPQLFPVLRGLRLFYSIRAEHQTACDLGEQLLRLAQGSRDPALLVEAHMALQAPLLWLGEVTEALQHAEQGIALYARQQHRSQALVYGQDPGVACRLTYAAFALWYLGYPTQALNRSHEALTLAQELAHPFSLAYAMLSVALLHHFRREGPAVQERAEAVIALSSEQGFAAFVTWGTMLRGWALVNQEDVEGGITQMRQGLTALRATGVEVIQPYWLLMLAEAYGKGGQVEEEFTVLAEALALARKNGTLVHEAELYQLYGELSLRIGEAETGRTGDKKILSDSPFLLQRNPSRRRLRLPESSKRSLWSCGRQQAWLACGSNRASRNKRESCWRRFMAGSPRDLIRRTCKRRKHC